MTENLNKRDQVKKDIRSILMSAPKGCTERQLMADYKDINGFEIPYKFFGYQCFEDFLFDIPDVVNVQLVRAGGRKGYVLTAVATSSTQHIQKLVAKQKVSTSGYSNPYREISRKGGQSDTRYFEKPRTIGTNIAQNAVNNHQGMNPQSKTYTPTYGTNIAHSAVNNHQGMNLQSKTYTPTYVPPRFRSVPNMVKSHVRHLLSAYPNGLRLTNFERAYNQKYGIYFTPSSHGFRNITECLSFISDVVELVPDRDSFKLFPIGIRDAEPLNSHENINNDNESNINEAFKLDIRRVLSYFSNGIYLNQFSTEYEKLAKKPLNCHQYGFHTVLEMVGELKDIFYLYRTSKNDDFLLFDAQKPPVFPSTDICSKGASPESSAVPHRSTKPIAHIKDNIEKVLLAFPDGIRMTEFQEVYKNNCGEDLPWKELSYKTLETFLLGLGGPIQLVPCRSGTILIFHNTNVKQIKQAPIPECPVDLVLPGTDFTYKPITEDMCSTEQYFGVFISQVNNPDEIYFQRRGQETIALERLMTDLDRTYNEEEGQQYVIPDNFLKPSMVCAAIYPEDHNWHRAKITKIISPNYVEVIYVDYGTKSSVQKKYLRFLRKEFLTLNAQATQARLANVKPLSNAWPISSKNKLLELCAHIPLMARINSITYKNTISLVLCDTNGEEDIFLHQLMIRHSLAEHSADDESELISLDVSTVDTAKTVCSPTSESRESDQRPCVTSYNYTMSMQAELDNSHWFHGQSLENRGIDKDILAKMNANRQQAKRGSEDVTSEYASFSSVNQDDDDETFRSAAASPDFFAESGADSPNENETASNPPPGLDDILVESAFPKQICFSRTTKLNAYTVNIVNYGGKPYMTSGDISRVIWGIDIVKKVIKLKNIKDVSITVCKENEPELFADFEKNNVTVLEDGLSVHLFPLESVVEIVNSFHKSKEHVIPSLETILQTFDPRDLFWSTEVEDPLNNKEIDPEKKLSILTQKKLQILTDMIQTHGNTSLVDDLRSIEEQIALLQHPPHIPKVHIDSEKDLSKEHSKSNTLDSSCRQNVAAVSRQVQSVRPTVVPRTAFVPNPQLIPQIPLMLPYGPLAAAGMHYYPNYQLMQMQQNAFAPQNMQANVNYPNWSPNN